MKPGNMTAIINRTKYDTHKATLLCGDDYWDGHNFERSGRNQFLYRTPNGNYFFQNLSQWQGESDTLEPCSEDEAISFFESCREEDQRVTFEKAFPNVKVKEA
jgi:hypothetical protein